MDRSAGYSGEPYSAATGQPGASTSILDEAAAVVKDRQAKYGSPLEHWTLTVGLINRYFGTTFTPAD